MSKKTIETRNNTTTNTKEVTSLDIIKNVDSNTMLSWILGDTALEVARNSKELEKISYDGADKVVNPRLRDFYKQSYGRLNTVSDNTLLAKRKLIVAIMDSEDFKASFVNDKDFAESIGETKTFISKAKSCVRALNWLRENGYGDDWNTSQLDEFSPTLTAQMKLDKAVSFNTMLHVLYENGVFNSALSARKMRELMQNYLNEYNKIVTPTSENGNSENESTANENTENGNSENEKTKAIDEYGVATINIALTLNNGRNIALVGEYKNGKGDDTYKMFMDMMTGNKDVMRAFNDLIQATER